jgi:hypothetical protein
MDTSGDRSTPQTTIPTEELQELRNRVSELSNALYQLTLQRAQPSPASATNRHINKPPEYDGKDKQFCSTFISHLNLYISVNASLFPTDRDKVAFAASYLRGQAFSWFEPHLLRQDDPLLDDFQAFTEELIRNLGDPDRERSMTSRLQSLTQIGSASSYASNFFKLSAFLNWNDDALRAQFYSGLKSEVKDALALSNVDPTTVQELSALAIRLDNRLHERRQESKTRTFSSRPTPNGPQRNFSRPQTGSTASTGPRPMDLDATKTQRFKPLTNDERQRRMKENLCLYCGKSGHRVDACPEKPRKASNRIQATLTPTSRIEFKETADPKVSA